MPGVLQRLLNAVTAELATVSGVGTVAQDPRPWGELTLTQFPCAFVSLGAVEAAPGFGRHVVGRAPLLVRGAVKIPPPYTTSAITEARETWRAAITNALQSETLQARLDADLRAASEQGATVVLPDVDPDMPEEPIPPPEGIALVAVGAVAVLHYELGGL